MPSLINAPSDCKLQRGLYIPEFDTGSSSRPFLLAFTSAMVLEIEYPITRSVQWRWLAPVSYASALVVIALLTVINGTCISDR